ncbi:MAG: helix-turn-helix transcriptional regulator [Spirochaetales bacterium]|jgi:DNA-binding CsgD family transcriptional regulator|nr:helix-turn-helix transcriptional regulator [Exilispira sp.]NMC67300.1 helix-turn-helix transcriptional regulator [Spirochaetales bacterium]
MEITTNLMLIYWFLCYTLFLSLFIVSGIRALQKIEAEKYHFLMILSFALLMINSTLYTIIEIKSNVVDFILQMLVMAGICLGIYSIPAFAHNLSDKNPKYKIIIDTLKYLALLLWFTNLINYIKFKRIFIFISIYIIYFIVILITSTIGIFSSKKNKNNNRIFENNFYITYISRIGILSIFFVPLFIIIDLFGGFGFKPISILIQYKFRTFPMFFLFWSIIYFSSIFNFNKTKLIYNSLNVINKNNLDLSIENLNKYLLSPREIEVLQLLLSGLSYKQIASSLSISLATVKTHICRIYEKTKTNSKIELINKIMKE